MAKRDYSRLKKIIAGAAVLGIAAVGIGAAEQEPPPMQTIVYTVQPGDTLWHIAGEHISDDENIEELLYQIRQDNNIQGAAIQPGQKIIIKKELPDSVKSDNPSSVSNETKL